MVWTNPPTCKSCETKCRCYEYVSDNMSETSCSSDCTINNCRFCRECMGSYSTLAHDEDELKIFVQDLFVESKKQKEILNKLENKIKILTLENEIKILTLENEKLSKRISTLDPVYNFKLNPYAKPFYPR